jgi:hypothetical protein
MKGLRALERYVSPREPVAERCELCAEPLGERHGHVVDTAENSLRCVCRPCSLSLAGARGGRYRGVHEDVRDASTFALGSEEWEALGIPVGLAFAMRRSAPERWAVVFPSPAGPVEAELSLPLWSEAIARFPVVADLESDVEGLLIRRERNGTFEALRAPIDACYRLVALVRRHYRGFDGGEAFREEIDRFFAELRERMIP